MSILYLFYLSLCISQVKSLELSWVGGSMLADQLSTVSGPGGRSATGTWQDGSGTVWLFGGRGMSVSSPTPVLLNDVWSFSLSDRIWKQVHPGTVSNLTVATYRSPQIPQPRQAMSVCGVGKVMVVFGGLSNNDQPLGDLWVFDVEKKVWRMLVETYSRDLYPSLQNSSEDIADRDFGPSPRGDAAFWCTRSHLYIFGGRNDTDILSDMWHLNLNNFTWEETLSSVNAPSSLRDHKTADYPQNRNGAVTWLVSNSQLQSSKVSSHNRLRRDESNSTSSNAVDRSESQDVLFMFGGKVLNRPVRDMNMATDFASDMWQYNISADSWHYVVGNTQPGQPANYGHLDQFSRGNVPGCRRGAVAWTDASHRLWMFGGEGADVETPSDLRVAKLLSDLWLFHPEKKQWSWMGGSETGDSAAVFKEKGKPSCSAVPGGRVDSAAWTSSDKQSFFLFGGLGHDGAQHDGYLSDLWVVDVSASLSYDIYVPAVYGFAAVFAGVALLLCLIVVALYSRGHGKSSEWRRSRHSARYNLLQDSDT